MKHLKLFGILFSSFVLILMSSCQKEPSTSFTMSKTSIKVGETVSFTNTTSDGDSYEWSFGDGQTSTSASPTHTYNSAGTFTITLTAYSKNGKKKDKSTATLTVIVIQTTDLAMTVYIDGTTTTVDACLMQLFTTQTDWDNYTNVVVSGNTDYNGQITFTDLQPIVYYVDAYRVGYTGSGYYSNWDLGYITNSLVANTINYYNIYVEYTAKKGGTKSYKIVKVEPSFPGDENAENSIVNDKRKNITIEFSGNELKK